MAARLKVSQTDDEICMFMVQAPVQLNMSFARELQFDILISLECVCDTSGLYE
jgi:hypothetical protein